MTRFLAISDIHAHPFPYGASYVAYPPFKGLHNSRLVSTMKALEGAADYAVANGIEVVLFGGDMFHTRQSVKTVARNMVTHVIKEKFVNQGLKLVMIPGNHDYADRVGHIHSLQSLAYLSPDVHVVDQVAAVTVAPDLTVICVPYTDSVKKARTDLQFAATLASQHTETTVLLCHLGVQGAKVGSDYVLVCPSDVGGDEIPFDQFDICLFGHYHQHQMLAKNAWFIGALTQQNWSDTNGNRGFIDIGVNCGNSVLGQGQTAVEASGRQAITRSGGKVPVTRIETSAPKFLIAQKEEDLDNAREIDFVTYLTTETLTERQQQQLRQRCPAAQVDIKPLKKDKDPALVFDATQLNAETALEPWVDTNLGDLEKDPLLSLGKELLAIGQGNALQTD